MTKVVINGSTELKVEQNGTDLLVNGTKKVFDLKRLHPGSYHLLSNGVSYNVEVIRYNLKEKKHVIRLNGKVLHIQMNIPVKEGDLVKKGDTLVILEAMKMENALKATVDATVKKVAVTKGKVVDKNEVLIYLSEQ